MATFFNKAEINPNVSATGSFSYASLNKAKLPPTSAFIPTPKTTQPEKTNVISLVDKLKAAKNNTEEMKKQNKVSALNEKDKPAANDNVSVSSISASILAAHKQQGNINSKIQHQIEEGIQTLAKVSGRKLAENAEKDIISIIHTIIPSLLKAISKKDSSLGDGKKEKSKFSNILNNFKFIQAARQKRREEIGRFVAGRKENAAKAFGNIGSFKSVNKLLGTSQLFDNKLAEGKKGGLGILGPLLGLGATVIGIKWIFAHWNDIKLVIEEMQDFIKNPTEWVKKKTVNKIEDKSVHAANKLREMVGLNPSAQQFDDKAGAGAGYGVGGDPNHPTGAENQHDDTGSKEGAYKPGDADKPDGKPDAGKPDAGKPTGDASAGGKLDDTPGKNKGPSLSQLYNYLLSKGATKNEALMLSSAAKNESGLNPGAIHDKDKNTGISSGYGMFGHRLDRRDALFKFTGTNTPTWQQETDFALADARKRGDSARANKAKTPEEITDAQMFYERPHGFGVAHPRSGLNYQGRLDTIKELLANPPTPAPTASAPEPAPPASAPEQPAAAPPSPSAAPPSPSAAPPPEPAAAAPPPESLAKVDSTPPPTANAQAAPDNTAKIETPKEKEPAPANAPEVKSPSPQPAAKPEEKKEVPAVASGNGAIMPPSDLPNLSEIPTNLRNPKIADVIRTSSV